MAAYVLAGNYITDVDMQQFLKIEKLAKTALSWQDQEGISCHSLVRACKSATFDWAVGDGYFGRKGCNHSWLWKRNKHTTLIIDVYPVGGFAPFIIDAQQTPWNSTYVDDPRAYTKEDRNTWAVQATKIYQRVFYSGGISMGTDSGKLKQNFLPNQRVTINRTTSLELDGKGGTIIGVTHTDAEISFYIVLLDSPLENGWSAITCIESCLDKVRA